MPRKIVSYGAGGLVPDLHASDLHASVDATETLPSIAVLIPCYNEALTVATVVSGFRACLPRARVYVYDNNSEDRTREVALAAGALVRTESLQGKGHVVRRMFADIEADVYVLVDGDATYDARSAEKMIRHLIDLQLDMVVGCRASEEHAAYRPGHELGNRILTAFVARLFGNRFSDILSGYRVLSRRFVKSFPALAYGFDIETDLTVHALQMRIPAGEITTPYTARPAGSVSKLNTCWDGLRILTAILRLLKDERPLAFFGIAGAVLASLAFILATPLLLTYLKTGLVPRFPTAILATGMMILAFLSIACGLILDTVTQGRREMKRLAYLAQSRKSSSL